MDEGEDGEREEELDPGHGEAVDKPAVLRAPVLRSSVIIIIVISDHHHYYHHFMNMIAGHLVTIGEAGQTQELHGPGMQLLHLEPGVEQNGGGASKS